jgi:lysozyme
MTAFLAWLRSLLAQLFSQPAKPSGTVYGPPGPVPVAGPGTVTIPHYDPAAPYAIPPPSAGPRQINAAGLALVMKSEGLRLTAYRDGGGVWTIGCGHTGLYPEQLGLPWREVGVGQTLDEVAASALLNLDLATAENAVAQLMPGPLTDNQFAALVDFTFNEGVGALHQLLAHGVDAIPTQLLRWEMGRVGGVEAVEPGLLVRRQREVALWQAT